MLSDTLVLVAGFLGAALSFAARRVLENWFTLAFMSLDTWSLPNDNEEFVVINTKDLDGAVVEETGYMTTRMRLKSGDVAIMPNRKWNEIITKRMKINSNRSSTKKMSQEQYDGLRRRHRSDVYAEA